MPEAFPDAAALKANAALGPVERLQIDGDLDGDGDYDRLQAYGARSFTIWDAYGNLVFDSSDQLETITALLRPRACSTPTTAIPADFDTRSDNKGPEPEGVTVGEIDGRTYAFVGLERAGGGVLVYDVTDPTSPQFEQYARVATDVSPEGLKLVPAGDSPNGQTLLLVTSEVSKTFTVYGIDALDFGDAPELVAGLPARYPTRLADDGARHKIRNGMHLGAGIDAEGDGQPEAAAAGDDLAGGDDEDGVVFDLPIRAGLLASIDVTASTAGLLNAWLDFNADGDWVDAGEQIFSDKPLVPGVNTFTVLVPPAATAGPTFARFRFDSAGGLAPTGLAGDGEVEDYLVEIEPAIPDHTGLRAGTTFRLDVNGDGRFTAGVDRSHTWGRVGDKPLIGDWNGDGYDEIGLRQGNKFLLDLNGDGVWTAGVDLEYTWGLASDTPLVGDWNGDGRDEIGSRRGTQFRLDVDGNGIWAPGTDRSFSWGRVTDKPLVGDWNGDGRDETGMRRGNLFLLDLNGDGVWTAGVDRSHTWGLAGDTPLVGDWNGDGRDEIGSRSGTQFRLDMDGNGIWAARDRPVVLLGSGHRPAAGWQVGAGDAVAGGARCGQAADGCRTAFGRAGRAGPGPGGRCLLGPGADRAAAGGAGPSDRPRGGPGRGASGRVAGHDDHAGRPRCRLGLVRRCHAAGQRGVCPGRGESRPRRAAGRRGRPPDGPVERGHARTGPRARLRPRRWPDGRNAALGDAAADRHGRGRPRLRLPQVLTRKGVRPGSGTGRSGAWT